MDKIGGLSFMAGQHLNALPDLLCLTDLNGCFIQVNPAWNQIVNKPEESLAGKRLAEFVALNDRTLIIDHLAATCNGHAMEPVVVPMKFLNSDSRFIEWRSTRINDEIFWVSRDVSSTIEGSKSMETLISATGDFLQLNPEDLDYQRIADQIRELSQALYVVVNIYTDDGNVYATKAISGIRDSILHASKLVGFPLIGKKWPYDPVIQNKSDAHCLTCFENLSEFAGHFLPETVIRIIDKSFNLGQIWLARIKKDGVSLGDFTLIFPKGQKFNQLTVVEGYTRQVGLLLARHKVELEMRQSEARFKDLFNKDLTGNFISSVDGEFILINEAFARIFGFESVEEMMTDRAEVTYINDEDRDRFLDLVREKRHLDFFEETLKRRDGREIVVLENVNGEFDENDELVRLQGYLIDITDRKQAENRLKDSERLLNSSQKISGIGSYILNIENGTWSGSEVLDEMFGITVEDDHTVGSWLSVIHPDDRTMMDRYFSEDVLEKRGRFDKEYRVIRKSTRTTLWVHGIGEVEYNDEGNAVRMIGTIQDITGRKRNEDALRRSEELFKAVVYNSSDLTVLTDESDNLLFISPQCESVLGFSGEMMVGKKLPWNIHPDDRDRCRLEWGLLKTTGKEVKDLQYRFIDPEGRERWLNHSSKPVLANDHLLEIHSTIRDITEKRRVDQELLLAKERAEASDRLKTAFMNNISHEVRTPLNGILGFGEMITEPGLSEEDKAFYLGILNSSSERLLNTINDYMDISLISSGNMEIRPSLFNLTELLQGIYTAFLPRTTEKNIELKVSFPEMARSYLIDTDGEFLRKVLSHLLDNAVKYSSGGTIEFGYTKTADLVEFYVKDDGIGITIEKQSHIFDYFIQEDSSITRRYEGSGLGLSIAKGLVSLMGGTIWVESEKGKGSKFYFTINTSQ